jgi:hypothetical protein
MVTTATPESPAHCDARQQPQPTLHVFSTPAQPAHPPCKPAAVQTIPSRELLQNPSLLQSPNKRQQGQKQANSLLSTNTLPSSPCCNQRGSWIQPAVLRAHCCYRQLYTVKCVGLGPQGLDQHLAQSMVCRTTAQQQRCRAVRKNCMQANVRLCMCLRRQVQSTDYVQAYMTVPIHLHPAHASHSSYTHHAPPLQQKHRECCVVSPAEQTPYLKQPHAPRHSCTVCHKRQKKYSTDLQQPSAAASTHQHHICMQPAANTQQQHTRVPTAASTQQQHTCVPTAYPTH